MEESVQQTHRVFSLLQADPIMYSKYFATYRKNVWFRPSWLHLQQMMRDTDGCYWIMSEGTITAGISISENALGSLFVIPPFHFSQSIAAYLKEYIIERTSGIDRIHAYNVLPEHIAAFAAEGFEPVQSRKCMIRPTEDIPIQLLPRTYKCLQPSPAIRMHITRLILDSYHDHIDSRDHQCFTQDILDYFEHHSTSDLLEASSMIVDEQTEEFVGVCLVSLWEGLPLIYEIAIKPGHRGKGLAKHMLRKAIHELNNHYYVLRLFVTTGNPAEGLYQKLGFLPGDELTSMVCTTNPMSKSEGV
ncbi:ribosomal protein S18 acetylase RimI-like enzyme [Paenibacillus sp. LBL]|uniref:GNAT family N-acetyltransferase n=1 Tax=Paenibacillus sp. LBL TaxID=2940563 RepID=UPI00247459D6|nr:GNAT family N-acetyltransferase [Paenibacillus sp. LBL]MDH6669775.1 ribosomal protein S18 acetylase RimI-like enzyme [Paenibacillus sp. LBL]